MVVTFTARDLSLVVLVAVVVVTFIVLGLVVVVVVWNMAEAKVSGPDTSVYQLGVVMGTFLNPGFKRKMKKE